MSNTTEKYQILQANLAKGWNTWNSQSVLQQVLLPYGLALNLAFKQHNWLNEKYLKTALIGRSNKNAEIITPGWHSWDGSFSELQIKWQQLDAVVQSAHIEDDLVILITQKSIPVLPVKLILEMGMLWNYPGKLSLKDDVLLAEISSQTIKIFCTAQQTAFDPYVESMTPFLCLNLQDEIGISSGKKRSVSEIKAAIQAQKKLLLKSAKKHYGDLAETFLAVQAGIAWNTIFEPKYKRVVSTVGRLWNREYGGYCLFGWDNFFLAYICSIDNPDLAIANLIEHMKSITGEGFIPNDDRGNGTKSFDRSQPPVGSIMTAKIYEMCPEKWVLQEIFDDLLSWNRWWLKTRMNNSLLSYGSHLAKNILNEPNVNTIIAAKYESGMDDSPMYSNVPFNKNKNVMELIDVGLNSLYIADCKVLVTIAEIIGKDKEVVELNVRAEQFSERIQKLWNEEAGCFLNFRTDLQKFSAEISPTMFFPLLAGIADEDKKEKIIKLFYDHQKLGGDWILPSITRDHPDYHKQCYWKGAIWPPLNFLAWLSFKAGGLKKEADLLADRSEHIFMKEWKRKGFVCENYSALSGTGDDDRLSSDSFHSWGSLMGVMKLI